jgi:hypothetical protein
MLAESNTEVTPLEKSYRNFQHSICGNPEPSFTTVHPKRTFKLIDDYSFYIRAKRILCRNHPKLLRFIKFRGIIKDVQNHLNKIEEDYIILSNTYERW